MRVVLYLLQKEFIQILRNKAMLPIIFVAPVVQLFVLTYAANFELKDIPFVVLDSDRSSGSRQLVAKMAASPRFRWVKTVDTYEEGIAALDRGDATLFLRISQRFHRQLIHRNRAAIALEINSIDGQAASLANGYAMAIIRDFNKNIVVAQQGAQRVTPATIDIRPRFWFNEAMDYKNLMVPGLLALLVTMVGMFLSAMNIVREKEIGTIEQLNVTPVSRAQFLIGKLFPFWILALIELAAGLYFGHLVFRIPLNGNILLLFAFAGVYLLVVLGLGLWISTITRTQQQAMFLSWFFMVIFILMSGLFTPIENMPEWAQMITRFNPVAYFVKVIRGVLLRGSGFHDIAPDFAAISMAAMVVNVFAVMSFRKRA